MPGPKKTQYAILGLLGWRPMSGYDIKRLIEAGLSHFWSESYGALYPTLDRLERAGLVRRRADRGSGERPRYVFSITPRGRRELARWLRAPAEPPRVRNETLLKLFLAPALPAADSAAMLEGYREQQRALLDEYAASERVLRLAVEEGIVDQELEDLLRRTSGPARASRSARARQLRAFLLTLRHGVLATQARLAWCDEALELTRGGEARSEASNRRPAG